MNSKHLDSVKTRKWLISGRVQGVGFRHFTYRTARELNVNGTVRNLSDGRVEVVAQADPDTLERFYRKLSKGPQFALVTDIETEQSASVQRSFDSFRIIHH